MEAFTNIPESIGYLDNQDDDSLSADDISKSFQKDSVLILRFVLTLVGESLTLGLFLVQDCGMGNPLLVQVMIVWPFFMGLTFLVFIVFNFIDNIIFDLPTAEEVAALASQQQARMLPGFPQDMLLQPNNQHLAANAGVFNG